MVIKLARDFNSFILDMAVWSGCCGCSILVGVRRKPGPASAKAKVSFTRLIDVALIKSGRSSMFIPDSVLRTLNDTICKVPAKYLDEGGMMITQEAK